jgi:hypothetical protein
MNNLLKGFLFLVPCLHCALFSCFMLLDHRGRWSGCRKFTGLIEA